MVFSKSFPKKVEGSSYPIWEDIYLSKDEEQKAEVKAREENMEIMKECISDATKISDELKLSNYQSDVVRIACSLFDKRASHEVFHKEEKCKEKFNLNK